MSIIDTLTDEDLQDVRSLLRRLGTFLEKVPQWPDVGEIIRAERRELCEQIQTKLKDLRLQT